MVGGVQIPCKRARRKTLAHRQVFLHRASPAASGSGPKSKALEDDSYIMHTHYYLERLRAAKRRSQKMLLLSYRSMRRFGLMPNGLGEGCEVGAWAPTSTTIMTHSVLETLKRAHIDSTRFARQHAVPSPSRPRPTTNAIGAGRRHATVSCEASAPLLFTAITMVRWLS